MSSASSASKELRKSKRTSGKTRFVSSVSGDELHFVGQCGRPAVSRLRLKNVCRGRVAFKVQSDHSSHYKIAPRCGFIDGGAELQVLVLLEKLPTEQPMLLHQFKVSAFVVDESETNRVAVWRSVKPDTPIDDLRLRASFRWLRPKTPPPVSRPAPSAQSTKALLSVFLVVTLMLLFLCVSQCARK